MSACTVVQDFAKAGSIAFKPHCNGTDSDNDVWELGVVDCEFAQLLVSDTGYFGYFDDGFVDEDLTPPSQKMKMLSKK